MTIRIQDNHLAFPISSQDCPLESPFANLRRRSKETTKPQQTRAGHCRYQPSYQPPHLGRRPLKPDSPADAQWRRKRKEKPAKQTKQPPPPPPTHKSPSPEGRREPRRDRDVYRSVAPDEQPLDILKAGLCQCHCHGRLAAAAAFPTTATTACKNNRTTGCDEQRTGAAAAKASERRRGS